MSIVFFLSLQHGCRQREDLLSSTITTTTKKAFDAVVVCGDDDGSSGLTRISDRPSRVMFHGGASIPSSDRQTDVVKL